MIKFPFPNFTEKDVDKAVAKIDWEALQKKQAKVVAKYNKIFHVDRAFFDIVIDK